MSHIQVTRELESLGNERIAFELAWFFKTGPGEYGEGDKFLGIKVPGVRSVAARHSKLTIEDLDQLFDSPYHEVRFCALAILTKQFERAKDQGLRQELFDYYLSKYESGVINNWDLVDISATRFGRHWANDPERIPRLLERAASENLWVQRSAVILTFPMIADYDFDPTIEVSRKLVDHPHDLIHKAVGWSLREVGKKELTPLREFLDEFAASMPRTMLRYSIEKLPEGERQMWLRRKVQSPLARDR